MDYANGTGQQERMPAAMQAHYFDVDELRFEDLISLASEYADRVAFFDINNKPNGTWRAYFSHDETVVMARILITRPDRLRKEFDLLLDRTITAQTFDALSANPALSPLFMINQIGRQLDSWADRLADSRTGPGHDLSLLINNLLMKMDDHFKQIRQLYSQVKLVSDLPDQQYLRYLAQETPQGEDPQQYSRDVLSLLFHSLLKIVEMVQRAAARSIEATMISQQHDPAIGLLIAFLQLYRRAQEKINRYPERHRDFYYRQVLRMQAKQMTQDSTVLVFQPTVPGKHLRLRKGSEFLAPVAGAKSDIVFSTDDDVVINDARVASVYSLFFERNLANSPENELEEWLDGSRSAKRSYPTNCWVNTIATPSADAVVDVSLLPSQPLFGAPRNGLSPADAASARIGFALASKVLLLREGRRKITVTLQFDTIAGTDVNGNPDSLMARLANIAKIMGAVKSDIEYKVLSSMFSIYLTGAARWLPVNEYSAGFDEQRNQLTISFILGSDKEAIVAYAPAVHGEHYRVDTPLIRFEINNQGYLYPYGLLRCLPLLEIRVDVEVTGLRDLILHNNIGQLSPTVPFNPFGPLPDVGSYLIVGSAETAVKALNKFEIDIEWGSLPVNPGGFGAYYAGYSRMADKRDLSDVMVSLASQYGGKWLPVGQEPLVTLFSVKKVYEDDAVLPKNATLSLNDVIQFSNPVNAPSGAKPFGYTPAGNGGFFKITLAAPNFAFGHKDYAGDLAAALIKNNQPKWKLSKPFGKSKPSPLPNLPYTPLVTSISANYSATQIIDMVNQSHKQGSRAGMIHLHPMGWEQLGVNMRGSSMLLPEFDASGNLAIGFDADTVPDVLSLFFHLREDSLASDGELDSQVAWSYLSDNRWKPLSVNQILSDTTKEFRRPGIVTLAIPADINKGNTVLPSDLFWLRVKAEYNLINFCSLYSIHAHGVQVSRVDIDAASADVPVVIPANTIKRPRKAIAGLGTVTQIVPSVGGRLPEDARQLQIRTAERLKHKQRAIVPEDYERLVLEQFPEIERVKCFPNLSIAKQDNGAAVAGNVLVVGLPKITASTSRLVLPTLNGYLIAQVGEFLKNVASPSATIEVSNPEFQFIQVRCDVKLKPFQDAGRCINELNRAISEFIAPVYPTGNRNYFGWCLRQHELESYVLQQDYVEYVTNFSILSVVNRGANKFNLLDTAASDSVDVAPARPWCVPVPIQSHAINVIAEAIPTSPKPAGIDDLAIGTTFIIFPEQAHGKEE